MRAVSTVRHLIGIKVKSKIKEMVGDERLSIKLWMSRRASPPGNFFSGLTIATFDHFKPCSSSTLSSSLPLVIYFLTNTNYAKGSQILRSFNF